MTTIRLPLAFALSLLVGCASEPHTVDIPDAVLADELEARGPYLRCFEEPTDEEGATRAFGGFADGERRFEILEVRTDEPCTYTLALIGGARGEPLEPEAIPLPSGQFLHAEGHRVGQHHVFIVNRLRASFSRSADEEFYETRTPGDYEVVAIAHDVATGVWTAPVRVAHSPTDAVWLVSVERPTDTTFTVRYGVDRLHEMLFLSGAGRLSHEGVYEATLDVATREGRLAVEPARRVGDYELASFTPL